MAPRAGWITSQLMPKSWGQGAEHMCPTDGWNQGAAAAGRPPLSHRIKSFLGLGPTAGVFLILRVSWQPSTGAHFFLATL